MAVETEIIAIEFRTGSLKDAQKELGKTADSADKAAESADRVSGKLSGTERAAAMAANATKMLVAAFGGLSVLAGARELVRVQREFDVLNSSLVTVTGSSANAQAAMKWIKEFAATTPYGLNEVTQGFVRMKALGLDPSRAALTSFGNFASAMGKGLNEMIEAVADASTSEFERLREFGVKAKQEGDQVSLIFRGVTTTIGNNAAEITQYLQAIGNNEFGGAMAERAKTLDGLLSNLGDTWDELYRTISSADIGSFIFDSVTLANNVIGDAITILNALKGAASETARETGVLKGAQEGLAVIFETVAVLGLNFKFVMVAIGREIGGVAAQMAALARFDFAAFSAIGDAMRADAEAARRDVDATTSRILSARRLAEIAQSGVGMDEPRFARLLNATNTQAAAVRGVGKAAKEAADADKKWAKGLEDDMKDALEWRKKQLQALNDMWAAVDRLDQQELSALETARQSYAQLVEQNDQLKVEIQMIGLDETARRALLRVKQEEAIVDAELALSSARFNNESSLRINLLEREVEMRKQNLALTQNRDIAEATDSLRKAELSEWTRHWDQVSQGMVDSLMQGGKSVAEYLKGLFRTLVLKPILSAVVNPVAAAFTGALGMPGAASAATGGASALSGLGSIGSMLGGFGTAAGYGAQALFAGNGLGALSGGMSMLGAGSISQGLGMIAGVAGPIIAGVTLISSLLKSTKSPGEQHTGGFFSSSGASGMDAALGITNGQAGWARDLIKRANPEIEAMVKNTVGSVIESTTAQAKALGMDIAVGIDAGFAANTNGKGKNKNAFGYFDVTINGETVAEYVNRTLGEDVTKATAQWTSDMTDAVAKWVLGGKDVIKAGETAGQALARLSTNLTSVNSTFDVLGYRMFDASVGGAALASSLVDAFGSLERFSTLTGQFYQSYYSDSERFATSQRLLRDQFAALNMTMPDSTKSFRAMVESAQAAGNNALLSNLLELGPAFYAVANAVEDVFNSISATTAQSVRDIEMSILGDAEKYQYLDREIEGLITKLSTATLPAEIEKLFGQINSSTMAAYNLLGADQQKGVAADFIDRLYEAEAIAQSRLSVTGNQATTDDAQAQAVQDSKAAAAENRAAATEMRTAATMSRQAAETMLEAAQTPKTIQLLNQYGQPIGSEVVFA